MMDRAIKDQIIFVLEDDNEVLGGNPCGSLFGFGKRLPRIPCLPGLYIPRTQLTMSVSVLGTQPFREPPGCHHSLHVSRRFDFSSSLARFESVLLGSWKTSSRIRIPTASRLAAMATALRDNPLTSYGIDSMPSQPR
jgi:hypothetical protein